MGSRTTDPLVSIVTPARNAAAFLPETIASVQAQTYGNWEMIIVDDASTDGTGALIEQAARLDSRIRPIHVQEKTGLAARARNLGLAAARGELIAFLDADDLWYPEKLETQVRHLREHPEADGVCCWFEVFGDPTRLKNERRILRQAPVCHREEFRRGASFQTSTVLLRRRIYDEIGGMDEDLRLPGGEDSEYFFRVICRYRIDRIRRVLSRYRLAPVGESLLTFHRTSDNARGWGIYHVLREKGALSPDELRELPSYLHYEQARENLFVRRAPFRMALLRSILAGHPPPRAVLIFALAFLPAPVLRPLLLALQRGVAALLERRGRSQADRSAQD